VKKEGKEGKETKEKVVVFKKISMSPLKQKKSCKKRQNMYKPQHKANPQQ